MERLIKNQSLTRLTKFALAAVAVLFLLRRFVLPLFTVLTTAIGAALVISPLCRLFEKKLKRPMSAALSVICVSLAILALASLVPVAITGFVSRVEELWTIVIGYIRKFSAFVPNIGINISSVTDSITGNVTQWVRAAAIKVSSGVSAAAKLVVSLILSFFLLRDRDRLLLALEMLIPLRYRAQTVLCAFTVYSELMLYLRAQLFISLCVGILSAVGLFAVGVPSGIMMGLMAGVMNVIPYLGPTIAILPVIVMAAQEGLFCVILSIGVMLAVQQIDGLILSPRVMGSVTGFPAAVVMIVLFSAGTAWGIGGMLLALPAMIVARTCVRVFVESHRTD